MLEGIQAPENMLRCVNNNYNIEGFWRSWHASYNRWAVER
jgi:D-alanyl-lipoteichoic acid acyltransferase DltB (MBOAT superfamily)